MSKAGEMCKHDVSAIIMRIQCSYGSLDLGHGGLQRQCTAHPRGASICKWRGTGLQVLTARHACRQWAFPLPLPLPLLGIFGAKELPVNGGKFPWSDELEHACLAEAIGAAPYSEVPAFLHVHFCTLHRK